MINLPVNVDKARLPAAYTQARAALATCERIDECKTWADKAAALASYAKQAKDESLHVHARRIQSRAIRRAGELLKSIEKGRGPGRTAQGKELNSRYATITSPRTEAARNAGLSAHRQREAVAFASIPDTEFEQLVESPEPPTVKVLLERGTRKQAPVDTAEMTAAEQQALDVRGWKQRAEMSAAYGRYANADTCPNTKEMRALVADAIAAWSDVLKTLDK
jgi:hypothetical protein